MGVGHEDDQQELCHVKQLLEGTLHPANDPSMLLLDLLLLYLEVLKGRRDRTMNTREHTWTRTQRPTPSPFSACRQVLKVLGYVVVRMIVKLVYHTCFSFFIHI